METLRLNAFVLDGHLLALLLGYKRLRVLDLSNSAIADVAALAEVILIPTLQELGLVHTFPQAYLRAHTLHASISMRQITNRRRNKVQICQVQHKHIRTYNPHMAVYTKTHIHMCRTQVHVHITYAHAAEYCCMCAPITCACLHVSESAV